MTIGNLHGLVRGVINSINPDISALWIVSTGNSVAAGGKATPTYADPVPVRAQVQAISGSDLRKYSFLQGNGIYRAVYMYANPDAINRVESKGGDLLQFGQYPTGAAKTWLITKVDEPWTASNGGLSWSRVIVCLQLDPNNPVTQS